MFHVPEQYRITKGDFGSHPLDGNNGTFGFQIGVKKFFAIASDGMGWEHVSVSSNFVPTWDIMCRVKKMFWDAEDCVVQYHPPENEYVNNCGTCLHLWRPTGIDMPRPPMSLVGLR